MMAINLFWEQPHIVENWATLSPHEFFENFLKMYPHSRKTRVLDLGCGAGRHTIVLAEQGFDVYAIDASPAMVTRTRERMAAILGPEEAARRVKQGFMEDLRDFASESFHLVLALWVYHHAITQEQ